MAEVLIKLPFDKTGKAPSNLILAEPHVLINRPVRAIVPEYGAFFGESIVVRDGSNPTPLKHGTQYQMAELYPTLSKAYGKPIWAAILITDPAVSNNVTVDYQALGGEYSYSQKAIRDRYVAVVGSQNPIPYNQLIDIPKAFIPKRHQHDGRDVYGHEYWRDLLVRIQGSIAIGDRQSHEDIYNYIAAIVGGAGDDASVVVDQMLGDHLAAIGPHPQYARVADIGSSISAVRRPNNVTPAAASASVLPNTAFTASPYYTYYGILQKCARFQISLKADFSVLEFDATVNGAVTTYTPPTVLHPSSVYYWRVRYQDVENAWSDWSVVSSFNTSAVTVASPAITSPTAGSDTQTESPSFAASTFSVIGAADTHAASDWELWTGPNGTGTKAFSTTNDATNKTSVTIPLATLAQNTKYYARVRYRGATYGYSNWSSDVMVNSVWPLRPTVMGQTFGGGYWGGDIVINGSTYAVIVAPKATGETTSVLYGSTASTANSSLIDSVTNTNALAASGAGQWAKSLTLGGFSDWCIPSANVMTLLWNNIRPALATAPANFKTGGADAFSPEYYWTSSAYNWTDSETDPPTPVYADVNHVDCSYSATDWYGPTDGTGPPASCPQGTVSNYRVGYFATVNPQGQWASLNTSYWCCNWHAYEVVTYTPGQTYYYNYYDAYIQYMSTSNSRSSSPKNSQRKVRAVRLVKVA